MTDIDKKDISIIINGIREMKKCAEETNKKYVDKKIISFAKEAKKDFLDNRNYMVNIINENIGLFFNLKNLRVSTSGACFEGHKAIRGDRFTYEIGNGVWVSATLDDFDVLENTGYHITFRVRKMTVYDIGFSTSDTRDSRYDTCSAWGLEKYKEYDNLDIERTAKEWYGIYCAADCTRVKNELLVREFKNTLNTIMYEYHKTANANMDIKNKVDNITGVYKKVNL